MSGIRLAVVGAGMMAERRARAFVGTGRVTVCGIASRRLERAQRLGAITGCDRCFDDVSSLRETHPDAVLIEVPHRAQDALTVWALEGGMDVLVGGCLASSLESGRQIRDLAEKQARVVEAGYEARYKAVWEAARHIVRGGEIGAVVAVRSVALFPADPDSWYYSEAESGGMPLTHMTYAFINPARWLFGEPRAVSAFANRIVETRAGQVAEEMCSANLLFPGHVVCNMTAGYVSAGGTEWSFTVIGSRGIVDVHPADMGPGELFVHRGDRVDHCRFDEAPDPFLTQANAFLDAVEGKGPCRNGPEETLGDLRVAEAIVRSAREMRTVVLESDRGRRPLREAG